MVVFMFLFLRYVYSGLFCVSYLLCDCILIFMFCELSCVILYCMYLSVQHFGLEVLKCYINQVGLDRDWKRQ